MKCEHLKPGPDNQPSPGIRWNWILVGASLLVILIAALLPREGLEPPGRDAQTAGLEANRAPASFSTGDASIRLARSPGPPGISAAQIAAEKLARFAVKRREIVHALADRARVQVPASVEEFFGALEAGQREEALALFKELKELHDSSAGSDLRTFWRAIVEAGGAAEQVQAWPAQKLLDYGNAVLGALRPGMVYVGGTDPGCFIPLMLNETGDGEPHIMFTQNALADPSYLDYLSFLYGDQMTVPASAVLPNEPSQVLPGEDDHVQVSAAVAEMLINEQLLQRLMNLNPSVAFALEESFPFKSTYAQAAPLGPVMELGVASQNALTPETAGQTVGFWQDTTDQLLADPEASGSSTALNAYAKMMVAQANLLVNHDFSNEAEQTFQLADELAPGNPGVVFNYVQFLMKQDRITDALQVTADALSAAPGVQQFESLNQALQGAASRR